MDIFSITKNVSDVNQGETLINKMYDKTMHNNKNGVCCICGKPYHNYGNNAKPFRDGHCCNDCNQKYVLPARQRQSFNTSQHVAQSSETTDDTNNRIDKISDCFIFNEIGFYRKWRNSDMRLKQSWIDSHINQ